MIEFSLMPLTDIHLYSKLSYELSPGGTIQYIYIFSAVALFILIIACINFMNLATARSSTRAKEIAIRKVLGTERKHLIVQFLSESIMISYLAVSLAVIIVYHLLPLFSTVSGKEINTEVLHSPAFLLFILLLPLIIGIIAGSYPALFLSRFMPQKIITGKLLPGKNNRSIRSLLVVFQFAASVILITSTVIVYQQLNYIQNKNLGYQKDQVLVINDYYNLDNNTGTFKNEMLKIPGVVHGTISGFLPIPSYRNLNVFYKEASTGSSGFTMQNWYIDYDYLNTLGIKILKGRNFSPSFGTDSSSVILNEQAVKQLGLNDPVGQKLYKPSFNGGVEGLNVIGVVKDFNFESLHRDIGPLCFEFGESNGSAAFKVNTANIQDILLKAEAAWENMAAGMPFSYSFLDESFNEMYQSEQQVGTLALWFSALAIMIACLGLFGLAAFLAEQKTKEIGIRKVLGASVVSILLMLSKEFIKWILIANIIAWPMAYYFMNKWLQDFAYKVEISWWLFVAAGVAALVTALLTISIQAVKAATANPVESLKYE
jgi:putative ABC transport system permease protein